MKITTIRTLASDCPVDKICPSVHTLDTHPERIYVITKGETDPDIQATFSDRLGTDDQLGWAPEVLFNDLVIDLDLHRVAEWPDRRYVIVHAEAEPEILGAFAPLIGPGEQLGWTPCRMSAGVA